jgi:hypothetical protein
MSEEMIFARKATCAVHTSEVIAEISMLSGPVNPLMSSQVLECDEPFAADSADLRSRAMPASVVASQMSASYFYVGLAGERQATYSFSDFEAKVLLQPWQDSDKDDPAWDGTALRFFRPGGGAPGRASFPKFVRSDTL